MGLRSRTPGPTEEDFKHRDGSLDRNDRSPLMSPIDEPYGRSPNLSRVPTTMLDLVDEEEEASKSTFYLVMLTLSIAG